jgi:plasmid stabilization system protein ParE
MTGYTLAPAARQDVLEITSFVAEESPGAAARLGEELLRAFALLAERPGLGHRRADLTAQAVRFWTVLGRYMVVYQEAEPVAILRVLSGYRDITGLLS